MIGLFENELIVELLFVLVMFPVERVATWEKMDIEVEMRLPGSEIGDNYHEFDRCCGSLFAVQEIGYLTHGQRTVLDVRL